LFDLSGTITFLSEQISHQQSANSIFLSEQISTSHQPAAKQTDRKGHDVWKIKVTQLKLNILGYALLTILLVFFIVRRRIGL
jgi:hypothetical protein